MLTVLHVCGGTVDIFLMMKIWRIENVSLEQELIRWPCYTVSVMETNATVPSSSSPVQSSSSSSPPSPSFSLDSGTFASHGKMPPARNVIKDMEKCRNQLWTSSHQAGLVQMCSDTLKKVEACSNKHRYIHNILRKIISRE